jgi:LacI family transcriptional regulator, repressor for deo operon, udp, cdd, tsx, nupC, and nupG
MQEFDKEMNMSEIADTGSEKKVTIRDIADAAGVSIGTVSRALKNQSGLSEQTRTVILRVAKKLGYDTTKLRSNKPSRLIFIYNRNIGSLASNPFYSVVLQGVENACREEQVSLSLLSIGVGDRIQARIRQHGPDAILVAGFFDAALLAKITSLKLPMVIASDLAPDCFCVNGDDVQGALLATRHLIEQGNQRIAMISGPMTHHSVALRSIGYRKALFEAGRLADPSMEVTLDANLPYAESAMVAMNQLLALPQRPDAVFVYNDETALNAIQACREAGLSVPEDIAFVGYDDIALASTSQPSLSTIRVDKEMLGHHAAKHLITGEVSPGEELLPVELIIRQSSLRG